MIRNVAYADLIRALCHLCIGSIFMLMLKTLEYSTLSHVDQIGEFSDSDTACLRDLREVLARHRKLNRFGISLLHKHFDIADDEILVERCDSLNRVLTTTPVSKADYKAENLLQTSWRFDGLPGRQCVRDDKNVHDHR